MKIPKTLPELLGILCICSIFVDMAIRRVLPFDFYFYYPVFLLFLISMFSTRGHIALPPRWFTLGFGLICVASIFKLLETGLLGFEFWKQVFGIVFSAIVYYNVLYVFEFDVKRIFNYYLKFAYWVALFGIFDNILHIAGIHITKTIGEGFQYRAHSIMGEPFYLALALTPGIAYYMSYFKRAWREKKREFLALLLCYLITYSSIAVAGLALSVVFALYLNDFFDVRKNRLAFAPLLILPLVLLINFLIENVELINARFNDTTELFLSTELQTREAGNVNSSTFALYSNYIIARDSFLEDPLFGSGLGSHPLIYNATFLEYFPRSFLDKYGAQNQQDANSKFLRLMSETGLTGLVLFMTAFLGFFAPKKRVTTEPLKELAAINYAIFIYILLCLIRNGNYINVGFLLFFFMYYVTWKVIRRHGARPSAAFQPTYEA
jgi:hypothetical protein